MYIHLLQYLEKTAAAFPDKVAFSDEREDITFSQLLRLSKAVGSCISEISKRTLRRPVIVPVDHTVKNVVAFLGVLFSGNFYVPVDQNLPDRRLSDIISSTAPLARIVFGSPGEAVMDASDDVSCRTLSVMFDDAVSHHIDEDALKTIREKIIDTDPAYIIFTSGTTGVPKGAVISHRAVIDLTEWLVGTFGFDDKTVFGCQTPFYFDASVKDMFITLKTGASAHLIAKKWFSFPLKLMELLNDKKINTILWATSAITLIANSGALEKLPPAYIKDVFFAGEVMHSKHLGIWQDALHGARFVNLYGPTEAAVDCTFYVVERRFGLAETIPIGKPCRNMDVFLLGDNGEKIEWEQAESLTGEICIRGSGLSFGYYDSPEKTDSVFVQNPLNPHYPEKIYRTGDFAKYNACGELVFSSRRDGQIKHMGNRIELTDIESALNSLSSVDAGICLYDKYSDKIVCIYQGEGCDNPSIIRELKGYLPKYMLPHVLVKLDVLPYSANGKIDRTGLLENYQNGMYNES